MNNYKADLYKVVFVPASATVTGKEFYAIVRQSNNYDPRVIDVIQNLLKEEAEKSLMQINSTNGKRI